MAFLTSRRILVIAASATEARSLRAVCDELDSRGVEVKVLDASFSGPGTAAGVWGASRDTHRLTATSCLSIRRLLRRLAPDSIVLGNDDLVFNRLLIEEGTRLGSRTVLVQEGATWVLPKVAVRKTWRDVASNLSHSVALARLHIENGRFAELAKRSAAIARGRGVQIPGYGFGGANVFCVSTRSERERFEAEGCRSLVVVTGIPDLISPPVPESHAGSAPKFDIVVVSAGLSRAGLATGVGYQRSLTDLLASIQRVAPGRRVALKYHPNAETSHCFSWLECAFPTVELLGDIGQAETVAGADAIIAYGSTMLLSAWFHGKIGICVDDARLGNHAETSVTYRLAKAHRSVVRVGDAPGLLDAGLRLALTGPDHELVAWVRSEFACCVDGGAAARIADEICR